MNGCYHDFFCSNGSSARLFIEKLALDHFGSSITVIHELLLFSQLGGCYFKRWIIGIIIIWIRMIKIAPLWWQNYCLYPINKQWGCWRLSTVIMINGVDWMIMVFLHRPRQAKPSACFADISFWTMPGVCMAISWRLGRSRSVLWSPRWSSRSHWTLWGRPFLTTRKWLRGGDKRWLEPLQSGWFTDKHHRLGGSNFLVPHLNCGDWSGPMTSWDSSAFTGWFGPIACIWLCRSPREVTGPPSLLHLWVTLCGWFCAAGGCWLNSWKQLASPMASSG